MKIALIDNHDSFVYNLRQYLIEEGAEVDVVKNNHPALLSALAQYDKIVLSPGPGIPAQAGFLNEAIRRYAPSKPMLGICLGEQAMAEVFGARLTNLKKVYHGVQTTVDVVADDYLFDSLPKRFEAGRYHSWVVDTAGFPFADLEITAMSREGNIMAIKHRAYDLHGLQFHPESVLTPCGHTIIHNFVCK